MPFSFSLFLQGGQWALSLTRRNCWAGLLPFLSRSTPRWLSFSLFSAGFRDIPLLFPTCFGVPWPLETLSTPQRLYFRRPYASCMLFCLLLDNHSLSCLLTVVVYVSALFLAHSDGVCVCVCVWMCISVCVCVCVCEREREHPQGS